MVEVSVTEVQGLLTVPRPVRMVLRNFSLYQRARTVEVSFEKDVFCLAGANGLGKSTFLAAMNFAITGTVARPETNFLGASKFYEDTLSYSRTFFEGRIHAADHDLAEVEMELRIGAYSIVLTRGMFSPLGLRNLLVTTPDGDVHDFSDLNVSEAERHGRYVDFVLEATGLTSFPQLVFLQWFVLTFDEQRHLLFWSDRVTEQALFLAFGISSKAAEHAEALQRTIDSADSKARNLQWQATGVRKRLEALEEALGTEHTDDSAEVDAAELHAQLLGELEVAGEEHSLAVSGVREAQSVLDSAVARQASVTREYEEAFERRVATSSAAHLHPVVQSAIHEEHCVVCRSRGPEVSAAVSARLDGDRCPLCGTVITKTAAIGEDQDDQTLVGLSAEVVAAEDDVAAQRLSLARRIGSLNDADTRLRDLRRRLDEFRTANTQALLRGVGDGTIVDDARSGMQREISDLLAQKDVALAKRDSARHSLSELRSQLSARYAQMESEFVPLLQDLAHEFLGVPLEVDLDRRSSHLGLSLNFKGTQRNTPDSLSESQRFFMDIALRMALARKLSHERGPATLYIDTPEGSLDIAYESRAGRMFGLFAQGEDRLIMTANINTSRLLQELASICGEQRMELVRMTEWAELTSVQQDAVLLFEEAYDGIEQRLREGGA